MATGAKFATFSALALCLWSAACLWYPLTDSDIWWHLAAAKLMWARHAFLRADPFCTASFGAPWTDLHWGFQILCGALWKLGGARALVAGKTLAMMGALAFALGPHFDRRTAAWLAPFAAFGLYHVRWFVDVRPLALTLLCLAIQYAATAAYLRRGARTLWILIPAQIFMANMQGLYVLGVAQALCLTAGEWLGRRRSESLRGPGASAWVHKDEERAGISLGRAFPDSTGGPERPLAPLWIVCALLALCGFATPYGWAGFKLPLALFARITPVTSNVFSSQIAENLPLADLLRHRPLDAMPFLCLGGFALYTFWRARRAFSPGHALLFLAFAGLGWMAQRNLPIAFMAALMAAGRNLQVTFAAEEGAVSPMSRQNGRPAAEPVGPRSPAGQARRERIWSGAIFALIVAAYGSWIATAWRFELPGSMETPFRFPDGAVDYLQAHPLQGAIFNELRYGGYLEFRLYPGKLAFVDGRMIVRTDAFYRAFLAAVDHPGGFEGYRRSYGITHAMLPISEDRRFMPLAASLLANGWDLLYCDGASALLSEPGLSSQGLPLDSLPQDHPVRVALRKRFASNPILQELALDNVSAFLRAAGRERAARDAYSGYAGPRSFLRNDSP